MGSKVDQDVREAAAPLFGGGEENRESLLEFGHLSGRVRDLFAGSDSS